MQIAILLEPAKLVFSWRTPSGEWREQRIVGPQFYVVAPGVFHASRWEANGEIMVLYVEERFWRRKMNNVSGAIFAEPNSRANRDLVLWQLCSTLRQLCDEGQSASRLLETVAGAVALQVMELLCGAPQSKDTVGGVLSPNRLRILDDYIRKELSYDIHVADLAKKVGQSVPHFTAVFKNTTGLGPYEYITRCRMLRAHELLATGEYRLGQVARAVGYDDQGHFTWRFRSFFKYTPKLLMMQARLKSAERPKKSDERLQPVFAK
ncbi:MAG: helix-turn-helix transcriptional regulator [Opitutae bacterium]|nr:helix-turn-helix transcriptional regulator [Opitutae bacterium]